MGASSTGLIQQFTSSFSTSNIKGLQSAGADDGMLLCFHPEDCPPLLNPCTSLPISNAGCLKCQDVLLHCAACLPFLSHNPLCSGSYAYVPIRAALQITYLSCVLTLPRLQQHQARSSRCSYDDTAPTSRKQKNIQSGVTALSAPITTGTYHWYHRGFLSPHFSSSSFSPRSSRIPSS